MEGFLPNKEILFKIFQLELSLTKLSNLLSESKVHCLNQATAIDCGTHPQIAPMDSRQSLH